MIYLTRYELLLPLLHLELKAIVINCCQLFIFNDLKIIFTIPSFADVIVNYFSNNISMTLLPYFDSILQLLSAVAALNKVNEFRSKWVDFRCWCCCHSCWCCCCCCCCFWEVVRDSGLCPWASQIKAWEIYQIGKWLIYSMIHTNPLIRNSEVKLSVFL